MLKRHQLLDNAKDPDFVERFLEEESFPLVEAGMAMFVFRGDVDAVNVRHWIYGLTSTQPCTRIDGTELWYAILEMPAESRVEYKFEIVLGDKARWIKDPLNPNLARDPYGANSVCYGEGYARPEWTLPDPDARQGSLKSVVFRDTPLGTQHMSVYLPARFHEDRRYNLLIVHDGGDFLDYADLKVVLDNLIHNLDCAPLIVALSHPNNRLDDYPNNEAHARYVREVMVPWLEEQFPLYGTPESRCLMGASFGAVASLSVAARYPSDFGKLLLQSGSFGFTDIGKQHRGPLFDRVVEFVNDYRAAPKRVADRVFISCGMYESLIYENRSMVPLFQSTGMEVRYVEARDGHNWENWRDRLREGLSWLFPGPQWMYYE